MLTEYIPRGEAAHGLLVFMVILAIWFLVPATLYTAQLINQSNAIKFVFAVDSFSKDAAVCVM